MTTTILRRQRDRLYVPLRSSARHAIEIAALPAKMRGFGHIKARNVESAKACEAELLVLLRSKHPQASAA